jgi:hypothetical protein
VAAQFLIVNPHLWEKNYSNFPAKTFSFGINFSDVKYLTIVFVGLLSIYFPESNLSVQIFSFNSSLRMLAI